MIDKQLTVLHNDNGSYADKSFYAKDFGTADFTFFPVAAEDKLVVGFYKPITSFYFEKGSTPNLVANTITAKYYHKDNAAFTALTIVDGTIGFTTSGFVKWDTPKNSSFNLLEGVKELDSKTLYWYEFTFSANHTTNATVKGLAPLFSCDLDLVEEKSNIASSTLLNSLSSWILKHQAARKHIVQEIRNRGNVKFRFKKDNSAGTDDTYEHIFANITEFDVLNFDDVRQASKYLHFQKYVTRSYQINLKINMRPWGIIFLIYLKSHLHYFFYN